MKTYIALIRGINVGGKKIILMNDLKKLFEKMDFINIKTYIQSGNVIFIDQNNKSKNEIIENIESEIKSSFGFEVKVIVKTVEEINYILKNNTYDDLKENENLYISLLFENPKQDKIDNLEKYVDDTFKYKIIESCVYIVCYKNYGKSLFSNNFLEKKLEVNSTTRNLATMNKVREIAEQMLR